MQRGTYFNTIQTFTKETKNPLCHQIIYTCISIQLLLTYFVKEIESLIKMKVDKSYYIS